MDIVGRSTVQCAINLGRSGFGKQIEITVPRHAAAKSVKVQEPKKVLLLKNAIPVMVWVKLGFNKAFFQFNKPAQAVMVRVRSSLILALAAMVKGSVRESKKLTVKIPAGVDNGDRVV